LATQSVVVVPATATYDEVYEKIKKTGKEIRSGEVVPGSAESSSESAKEEAAQAAPADAAPVVPLVV